jgi:photosynthetic reaction center cytochrome c subunit
MIAAGSGVKEMEEAACYSWDILIDNQERAMKLLDKRRTILRVLGAGMVCLLGLALAEGQPRPDQNKEMAEKVFKNVKVLTGIPVDEFMATMGFFSASLSMTCTDCHVAESGGSWARYADDTPLKLMTRRMIGMMEGINKTYFGGQRVVTCYSCHRGGDRPLVTPSLAELYGPPPAPREPDQMVRRASKGPSAEQILDKFVESLGGAEQVAKLTSLMEKGTYQGYADSDKYPIEVFAQAPNLRTTIVRSATGTTTTVFDGHAGWLAAPPTDRPFPLIELTGGDLEGAQLDAMVAFPLGLKEALHNWRVGLPTTIDDKDVQIVQATSEGRYPINFYFDKSGMLVRTVRYTDSPVGLNPTQVDYADYRAVAGVKVPFRIEVTWLDGRSITQLSDVQPNVPIDAAKFGKPAVTGKSEAP